MNSCGVNAGVKLGQCTGVKVGHRRCLCFKQEGPARGAFLLSRSAREARWSGGPLIA